MTPSMRFFTPDLYRAAQHDTEAVTRKWDLALDAYRREIDTLRAVLPVGLQALVDDYNCHDARFESAVRAGGILSMALGPVWSERLGHEVSLSIRYEGVVDAAALHLGTIKVATSRSVDLGALAGGDWLYEEIRAVKGGFELHVLAAPSHNELALFGVRFTDVECRVASA